MSKILFLLFLVLAGCTAKNDQPKEVVADAQVQQSSPPTEKTISQPQASEDPCATAFEKTISDLKSEKSFTPIYNFYLNHLNCMDGSYSAGIEGAISEALNNQWDQISQLSELFKKDPKFKDFFYKNIGCYVSGTENFLTEVVKKSKSQCPQNLSDLCLEISNLSQKALDYSKNQ